MAEREDSPEFSAPVHARCRNADKAINIVADHENSPSWSDGKSSFSVQKESSVDDSDTNRSVMESPKKEEEKKSGDSDNEDSDGEQEDDEEPSSSGAVLFAVEAVKRMRGVKPHREFFIKWHGYPEADNTWEPESGVVHLEIVQQFLEESESKKKEKEAKAFREAKRRKEEAERRHAEEKAARKRAKEDAARKKEKRRLKEEANRARKSSGDEAVGEESDAKASKTADDEKKKESSRSDSEERERLARKKARREERERLRLEEEKKRKSEKQAEGTVKSGISGNDESAVDRDTDLTEKDVTKRKEKSLDEDEAEKAARKKAKREEEQRRRDEIERRLKREAARDREEKERLKKMTPKEIAELEQSKRPDKKVSKEAHVERSEKPTTSCSFSSKVKDKAVAAAEEKSSLRAVEKDKSVKKKNDAAALFFGKKTEIEIKKAEVKKSAPVLKDAAVKEQQKSAKQEEKPKQPDEKKSRSPSIELDVKESREKQDKKAEKREKAVAREGSVEIDEKDSKLQSENRCRKTDAREQRSGSFEFGGPEVNVKKGDDSEAQQKRSSSVEFRIKDIRKEKEVVKPTKRKSRSSSVEFDAKDPETDLLHVKDSSSDGQQEYCLTTIPQSSPTATDNNRDRDCSPEITVPPRYTYTVPTRDVTDSESEEGGGSDAEEGDGGEQFEVRKILDDRWSDSEESQMYFVQWVGYTSEDDTWEPEDNLKHLDVFNVYLQQKAENAKKREEKRKEKELAKPVLPKDAYKASTPSSDEEEERTRKKAVERKFKRPEPAKTAPLATTGRPFKSSRKLTHMDKVFGVHEEDLAEAEEQARKDAVMSKTYRLTEKSQFQRPLDDGPSLTRNIAPVKFEHVVKDFGSSLKIPKMSDQKPAEPTTSVPDRKTTEAPLVQYLTEADGIFDSLAPQDRKYFKLVLDTSPALPAPRDPKPIMTYVPKDLAKLPYYVKPDRFDGLFSRMMFLRRRSDHPSHFDPPLVTGPHSMIEASSGNRNVIQQSRSGSTNIANYCDHFRRVLWPKQLDEERRNEHYVSREIELFLKFQAKNPAVEDYLERRDGVRPGAPQRKAVKRVQRPVRRY